MDDLSQVLEFLDNIQYLLGTLVVMKICEWIYHTAKLIHDWLSSMFPTSLGKR